MKDFGFLAWVAVVLVIIGGLNYGLVGFFDYNFIDAVFGKTVVARIVYSFIGVSAIWMIYYFSKCCGKSK